MMLEKTGTRLCACVTLAAFNDDAMPITFSNVTGNTQSSGELIEGQAYTAN